MLTAVCCVTCIDRILLKMAEDCNLLLGFFLSLICYCSNKDTGIVKPLSHNTRQQFFSSLLIWYPFTWPNHNYDRMDFYTAVHLCYESTRHAIVSDLNHRSHDLYTGVLRVRHGAGSFQHFEFLGLKIGKFRGVESGFGT